MTLPKISPCDCAAIPREISKLASSVIVFIILFFSKLTFLGGAFFPSNLKNYRPKTRNEFYYFEHRRTIDYLRGKLFFTP
jgi:hypothetical protein